MLIDDDMDVLLLSSSWESQTIWYLLRSKVKVAGVLNSHQISYTIRMGGQNLQENIGESTFLQGMIECELAM